MLFLSSLLSLFSYMMQPCVWNAYTVQRTLHGGTLMYYMALDNPYQSFHAETSKLTRPSHGHSYVNSPLFCPFRVSLNVIRETYWEDIIVYPIFTWLPPHFPCTVVYSGPPNLTLDPVQQLTLIPVHLARPASIDPPPPLLGLDFCISYPFGGPGPNLGWTRLYFILFVY